MEKNSFSENDLEEISFSNCQFIHNHFVDLFFKSCEFINTSFKNMNINLAVLEDSKFSKLDRSIKFEGQFFLLDLIPNKPGKGGHQ